ncbi:MAG: arginine repressor [Clostridia bacterium]|nr:arginine repressor [Clostridia bacterium]
MKNRRQEVILELIEHYEIQKQEELIRLLEERGFQATQATVSRDIRELKLMKGTGEGGVHKYVLPARQYPAVPKFNSSLTESIIKIDAAENLIVVKTYPGMASAVGSCIDTFNIPEIVGCVAGDDAILVVVRNREEAFELRDRLRHMIEVS